MSPIKSAVIAIAAIMLVITGIGDIGATSEATFWSYASRAGSAEPTPVSVAIIHLVHCFGWIKIAGALLLLAFTDADKGVKEIPTLFKTIIKAVRNIAKSTKRLKGSN